MKDCCTCIHEYRHPMSEVCRSCGIAILNYKERTPALTNADRIRAMSDEEMADAFVKIENSGAIHQGPRSKEKWLDWLKSPVEGIK